jgi:PAS domain S-box-containing protein
VSARPGLSTYLAPVGDAGTEIGILAVHRAAELSSSECTLVDALASQVSARQQNEQLFNETVEQRGHLADVVGSSSDGIFVLSGERIVLSWNPAMERITGFRGEEVIGRRFEDVLRLRGEPDLEGTTEQGLVLGTPRPQEALIQRRDGSERWIRYSTSGMPDRHGGGESHVVTARDVTAELEADQMKSDFVATVSHELRTPLTPLRGLLQSLDQGLVEDTPEARREYFAIMLRQTERLERLINDLLDVSRIDAGRLRMDSIPVEIGAAMEREVHDARQLPDAREVKFDRPSEPVWALVDQFRLGQIVSNLLSNAFKYSPAGTDVTVRLAKLQDHVVVSVQDSGEGIALADQERIFERFYRSNNGNTRTVGGFGLGLYIAKRLAEAMGGSLVLDSPPGRGCTFSLNLPLLLVNPDQVAHPHGRRADPAAIGTPVPGD